MNILEQFFGKEKVEKLNFFFYANNTLINPISNLLTIFAIFYVGFALKGSIEENTRQIAKSRSNIALFDRSSGELLTAQTANIAVKSEEFKNIIKTILETVIIDSDEFTNDKKITIENLEDEAAAIKLYTDSKILKDWVDNYAAPTPKMQEIFFEFKNRTGYIHNLFKDLKDKVMPENIAVLNSQITNYSVDSDTNVFTVNVVYYVKSTFRINTGLDTNIIRPVSSIRYEATGVVDPLKYYSLKNHFGIKFTDLKLQKPSRDFISTKGQQ